MGYTVGMPSMKLSNIEGARGKHCGNFKRVAAEALGERLGKDLDINPELSHNNINFGFGTAEELIKYSDEHVNQMNAEREQRGERKIRTDAVRMCATIIKPPAEMMLQLSREQQEKFLRDSLDCFKNIINENNIKAAAIHFDELIPHLHIFWEPMTQDGRLCGKEMHNLKYLGRLNREMPEMLRQKGWLIVDDCNAYDSVEEQKKREEMGEPAYREYRKELRAKRGRESAVFKSEAQSDVDELQEQKEALTADVDELQEQKKQLSAENSSARAENKKLKQENEKLIKENDKHIVVAGMYSEIEAARNDYNNIPFSDKIAVDKAKWKKLCDLAEQGLSTRIENSKLSKQIGDLRKESIPRKEYAALKKKTDMLEEREAAAQRLGVSSSITAEQQRYRAEMEQKRQQEKSLTPKLQSKQKSKNSPSH